MWKANGKTTTLLLFLDSLSPKTEKLGLEEAMDLSRDRLILELELRCICPVAVRITDAQCGIRNRPQHASLNFIHKI
jgi:hypothetical protein